MKLSEYKVNFKNEEIYLYQTRYVDNDNRALVAFSNAGTEIAPELEPYMTISVNIEDKIPDPMIIIKDYSENKGIYQCLMDNGYIKEFIGDIPLGYTHGKLVVLENYDFPILQR